MHIVPMNVYRFSDFIVLSRAIESNGGFITLVIVIRFYTVELIKMRLQLQR